MAFQFSPKVVTDSLILYIDAANSKSYSGTGSVWSDLSRRGISGTLVASPQFNSANGGSFVFNGTSQNVEFGSVPALQFSNTQAFSVSVWLKWTEASSVFGSLVTYASTGALGWYIGLDRSGVIGTNLVYFDYVFSAPTFRGIYTANNSVTTGVWFNITATCDSTNTVSGMRIYLNGVRASTTIRGSSTPSTPSYSGLNFQLASRASDNTTRFEGNVSQLMVYNRELSATEVLQNYNATKSRFGL